MHHLTKAERTQQIIHCLNNFYLGLAAVAVFENKEIYQHLSSRSVVLSGRYEFNFETVVSLLDQQEAKSGARHEFTMMLMRMLLKESFEVVHEFAKEHHLKSKLKSEAWFHVARLLRNCVSHDYKFLFSSFDRSLLPLQWKNLAITLADENRYLTVDELPPATLRDLVLEFKTFINAA